MPRGGYRWHKKTTIEESRALSTVPLVAGLNAAIDQGGGNGPRQSGVLAWGTASIGYTIERRGAVVLVRLRYTTTRRGGEKLPQDYHVLTTTTTPHYGGRRWWWRCPLVVGGKLCNRRVGKLYLPPGARLFGCRHCHKLAYESTRRYRRADLTALLAGVQQEMAAARAATSAEVFKQAVADDTRGAALMAAYTSANADDWRESLGGLSRLAGVPYSFAQEAQRVGLVRADGGRATRRRRYRRRLAGWLGKLHRLREAGYTWEAIKEWTARRFTPGHETERRWPTGFEEAPASVDK